VIALFNKSALGNDFSFAETVAWMEVFWKRFMVGTGNGFENVFFGNDSGQKGFGLFLV
jgi:hypothetical protein